MDQRMYHIREPSVNMDVAAAVFIFLLIAQAAGGPVARGALRETIDLLQKKVEDTLVPLDDPTLFDNIACVSMNITEQMGAEPQSLRSLAAHHLSPFRCCMEKVSPLTPELSAQLLTISQYIQDIELQQSNHTPTQNCSIPSFNHQEMPYYVYVKCLLQLLNQWISKLI